MRELRACCTAHPHSTTALKCAALRCVNVVVCMHSVRVFKIESRIHAYMVCCKIHGVYIVITLVVYVAYVCGYRAPHIDACMFVLSATADTTLKQRDDRQK